MSRLEIEWSEDSYDCDDCGMSWNTGVSVEYDGVSILHRPAHAYCYGVRDADYVDVLVALCKHLGISVDDTECKQRIQDETEMS